MLVKNVNDHKKELCEIHLVAYLSLLQFTLFALVTHCLFNRTFKKERRKCASFIRMVGK